MTTLCASRGIRTSSRGTSEARRTWRQRLPAPGRFCSYQLGLPHGGRLSVADHAAPLTGVAAGPDARELVLPPVVSDARSRRDYVTRRALLVADVAAVVLAYIVALLLLSPLERTIMG